MPRPTCKAAVVAGNKAGAQIYPKGCKVRRRVDKRGRETKTNAAGKVKQTVVARGTKLKMQVAVGAVGADFLWDTGAEVTTMGIGTAKVFKLLDAAGTPIGPHTKGSIHTANNQTVESFVFRQKRIVVRHGGRQYTVVTTLYVMKNGKRLLGVPVIRALRKKGLVVKFA